MPLTKKPGRHPGKSPVFLAFETSSHVLSVALKTGQEDIREIRKEGYFEHAKYLLPAVEQLLGEAGLGLRDVDAYLIGRGPGSFTGLRVGFSTLKGFLAVHRRACFGANSLDLLAERIQAPSGSRVCVCVDARRGKIYRQLYDKTRGHWEPCGAPAVVNPEEALRDIPDRTLISGDALKRYRNIFEQTAENKKRHFQFTREDAWYPLAGSMIEKFLRKEIRAKKKNGLTRLSKPADFIPAYGRRSEPEEKKYGPCR